MIWGENGSGKTSLLEAIYILSLGKSFKTHKQSSIIKKGHSNYILKGDFSYGEITKETKSLLLLKGRIYNYEGVIASFSGILKKI